MAKAKEPKESISTESVLASLLEEHEGEHYANVIPKHKLISSVVSQLIKKFVSARAALSVLSEKARN